MRVESKTQSSFLDRLQRELPDRIRFASEPDELEPYSRDRTLKRNLQPDFVLFPEQTEEVATIVRIAFECKQPLSVSGGRTGYAGGAVASPGEVILSFDRMNRLIGFDPYLPALTVQSGMTTRNLQREAVARQLYFPVDFASADSSQIGGNLATHAGGIRVLRYGTVRRYTVGLTAVDGRGNILRFPGLLKNNTGYDLKELLIGSEGTLALITEATLLLVAPPPPTEILLLSFHNRRSLLDALAMLRSLDLYAFEFFDRPCLQLICEHRSISSPFPDLPAYTALIEYAPSERDELLFAVPAVDIIQASDAAQQRRFWIYREGISEALSLSGLVHKNDISVPIGSMDECLGRLEGLAQTLLPESRIFFFGHLADGNVHVNLLAPADSDETAFRESAALFDRQSYAILAELGGSISAEHGIGRLKRPYLPISRSEPELELMHQIKDAFDPAHILNPGRIL